MTAKAWEHLKQEHPFKVKGTRCSFARYLAVVPTRMELLGSWARDSFYRTYTAIELDMLRGKRFSAEMRISGEIGTKGDWKRGLSFETRRRPCVG